MITFYLFGVVMNYFILHAMQEELNPVGIITFFGYSLFSWLFLPIAIIGALDDLVREDER